VSSSVRATKRCVAAAAGAGMIVASFAGAASSASAATHPKPTTASGRIHPHITVPGAGVTASAATRVSIPDATLRAGTSVAVPTVTVTDPGVITSGDTVTLTLTPPPSGTGTSTAGVVYDTAHTPTVTVSGGGAIAGPVTVTATTITFVVSKSTTAVNAKYTVSGIYLAGPTTPVTGGVTITASYGGSGTTTTTLAPFHIGAITNLIPAVYGQTAPDTAAILFRATFTVASAPTSIVLASDYAPQDAESAAYLARKLGTGIVLTDPKGLSSAVSSVLTDYPSITTVYIVGGTSVVSNSTATALGTSGSVTTVRRISGNTQYMTNQAVYNFASTLTTAPASSPVTLDYTQTKYNNTGGSSSPSSTGTVAAPAGKTAIVASGEYSSYQDGIASGPLSYKDGLPLILTQPRGLDAGAMQILISGGYTQVILLGGPLAVSNAVETQLTNSVANGGAGVTAFRVAGSDATDTAQLLASLEETTAAGFGFATTDQGGGANGGGVLIARGNGFQDALAAAPYAGSLPGGGTGGTGGTGGAVGGNTPILLTENATTLGAPLTGYLKAQGAGNVFSVQALGGPSSLTPAVQNAAINAEVAGLPTP